MYTKKVALQLVVAFMVGLFGMHYVHEATAQEPMAPVCEAMKTSTTEKTAAAVAEVLERHHAQGLKEHEVSMAQSAKLVTLVCSW